MSTMINYNKMTRPRKPPTLDPMREILGVKTPARSKPVTVQRPMTQEELDYIKSCHEYRKAPHTLTQEIMDAICDFVAQGYNITQIGLMEGMPIRIAILDNKKNNPEFAAALLEAEQNRADARADNIDKLKDDMIDGVTTPEQTKLAVDIQKWQAAREKPKKYNDKFMMEVSGTLTLTQLIEESMKPASEMKPAIDVTPKHLIK
jgi:hypothetical protein